MAVTIVQSGFTLNSPTAGTTGGFTMSAATAGNLLVTILFGDKNLGTINTPTSSGATSWVMPQNANLTSVSGGLAYKVADGGETTVTWTWTTTHLVKIYCIELSGMTSTPYDVSAMTATGDTSVKTRSTGTTGTTAQNDEYAIAAMMADTMDNCDTGRSWSNSFTEQTEVYKTGATEPGGSVAVKTLSATGTVETSFTTTGAGDQMMAIVATFKIDTGAAAGQPTMARWNGTPGMKYSGRTSGW